MPWLMVDKAKRATGANCLPLFAIAGCFSFLDSHHHPSPSLFLERTAKALPALLHQGKLLPSSTARTIVRFYSAVNTPTPIDPPDPTHCQPCQRWATAGWSPQSMAGELPLPLPAPPQGREHILQRQHALDNARRQYQQHPHPATTAAQPEISSAQQHLQKEGMQHAAPFGSDYSPHSSLQFGPPSPTNDYPAASSAPGPGGHYDPPGAGYEQHNTRGGILPTHSPPTGYTNGSMQVHDSASSSRPRRAGGAPGDGEGRFAGGFDPYAGGEDKVAEKAREAGYGPGGGSALYAGAGMGPIVPPGQKQSRYASMIPEQKPPKNLVSVARQAVPALLRYRKFAALRSKSVLTYFPWDWLSQMEHVAPLMRSEWFPLIAYTVLSLITRLAYIGRSPTVIWDEVSVHSKLRRQA